MKIKPRTIIIVSSVILVGVLYGGYRFYLLQQKYNQQVAASNQLTHTLQSQIATLAEHLQTSVGDSESLASALQATKDSLSTYEQQLQSLNGTVGTLTKITQTDPELLKKYSKVYFLNENYIPSSLTDIEKPYLIDPARSMQIHAQVWPHLQAMLDDSSAQQLSLRVASAYRSFGTQAILKSNYKITYGTTAANKFSAEQGYSEHQLGTTVDLTTVGLKGLSSSFEKTPEFKWLNDTAYKYGFILSYPKNNKYYTYEPWHWRYVGIDLATKLHDEGKYLYELDQRDIDGYLGSIFNEVI